MSDPHFNIFHAYRGPSASEAGSIRQLEDNLTRALVITLNHVHDSDSRRTLLTALGFPESQLDEAYQCRLQVAHTNPDWPPPEQRRLLVVHGGPSLTRVETDDVDGTGRADAVISTAKYLVAVESKIDDKVSDSQLRRHCETLEIPTLDVMDVTWTDLALAARSVRFGKPPDPIAQFVLSQFEEYLRMNGFGGLIQDHFTYLTQASEDRDPLVRQGIRRALHEIGTELHRLSRSGWNMHVMDIRPEPWAGLVLEPGRRAQSSHLTIAIEAFGLNVFANVELEGAYSQFRKKWKLAPQGVIDLIRQLGAEPIQQADDIPWRFQIQRRVYLGKPRQYHYWIAVDIATNVLTRWSDDEIWQFIERETMKPSGEGAPQITLIRSYPASRVLKNNRLSDVLVEDVRQLEPFFTWIGTPFR